MRMSCACRIAIMTVALQIKDVREEVRNAIAARAAARGQSMQVYLREILEREYRAERNTRLFDQMISHRSLALDAQDIVDYIRAGREGNSRSSSTRARWCSHCRAPQRKETRREPPSPKTISGSLPPTCPSR